MSQVLLFHTWLLLRAGETQLRFLLNNTCTIQGGYLGEVCLQVEARDEYCAVTKNAYSKKVTGTKNMGTNRIKQTSPSRGGGWLGLLLVSKHRLSSRGWQGHSGTYDCHTQGLRSKSWSVIQLPEAMSLHTGLEHWSKETRGSGQASVTFSSQLLQEGNSSHFSDSLNIAFGEALRNPVWNHMSRSQLHVDVVAGTPWEWCWWCLVPQIFVLLPIYSQEFWKRQNCCCLPSPQKANCSREGL